MMSGSIQRLALPWHLGLLAAALLLGLVTSSTSVHAGELKAALQTRLTLKILSFDRALRSNTSVPIVVAVVYDPDSKASHQAAAKLTIAFQVLSKKTTVFGRQVSVISLPFGDDFSSKLARVSVVHVATGLDSHISEIAEIAHNQKISTYTGSRKSLQRGLVVGVIQKNGKPAILLNLKAAKQAGLKLHSNLLRVAEIIR